MPPPRNTTYELIYHLSRGNIPSPEIPQVLSTIFDAQDHKLSIQQLQEPDLRAWMERLDQIVDSKICHEQLRRRTLRALRKTCGSRRVLPRSHYFPGRLSKASNRPARGGTEDMWRATGDRGEIFAAKVFRANHGEDRKIKRLYKEITVWKRLSYPNIVPTLGAGPDIAELCVVSPWMPDGDLLQYHQKISGANRVEIARAHAGHAGEYTEYDIQDDWNHRGAFLPPLQRCHSRRHEGGKRLFAGIPRIADFGVSTITFNLTSNNASTPYHGYSLRWAAPEILEAPNDESRRPTKMWDVYAFGMVVVGIFTGRLLFPDVSDLNVHLMVVKGKRPSKPAGASKLGLSSSAWRLIENCWNKKRDKRPGIQDVAYLLRRSWPVYSSNDRSEVYPAPPGRIRLQL